MPVMTGCGGGSGNDALVGGEGDDTVIGFAGQDTLEGGNGDDWVYGNSDGEGDTIDGGMGNDTIWFDEGDQVTGGSGYDTYVMAGSNSGGPVAEITDFNHPDDQLLIRYDPAVHPNPQITVNADPNGSAHTVYLDGTAVVVVKGGAIAVENVILQSI